jgi:multidrug resistance efflux pump
MFAMVNQGIQSKAELDRVESAFKVAESRYQDALEEVRNRQAVLLQRRSELAIAQQQLVEAALYAPFDGAVRERRASLGEYLSAGAPVAIIVRLHPLRLRVETPEREARGIKVGHSVRVVMVPAAAIVTFAGIQKVFSVSDNKAVEKNVVVGKRDGGWVVVEGLDANAPVVLSPGNLVSGQPVSTSK